ncbi:MAG TPA: tetratricopeptide repeat protein [Symbiobacteriaceae bacterium]|nr:tetratricopeptide repeat protein [Symbiobacteriaceae bacterium]
MAVDRLHSLVATGQFLAAYREVERLALDPTLDPSLKAKVFTMGVRAAAGLGEVYAAMKLAEKAVEAAELHSDWEDIGNARLSSALIYVKAGDTARAMQFFELFFEHLDRYPSLHAKTAHAYFALALTRQQRREYADAVETYKLARVEFERIGDRSSVLTCLQNIGWVLLLQRRPEEALPFIYEAGQLSAALDDAHAQVSQLGLEALYERETGNVDRAKALCEEIFQNGRQGVSASHLGHAAWILADIMLEANHLHEAGIFADWALSKALEAKEPHLMNRASELKQRVQLKKTQPTA